MWVHVSIRSRQFGIDGIINHSLYLNILRENLKLSVQNLGTLETTLFFIMMTILSITALNVRLWCVYNCQHVLKRTPQSPDLNPIEQFWGELREIGPYSPTF